jgi:hypothetical protein
VANLFAEAKRAIKLETFRKQITGRGTHELPWDERRELSTETNMKQQLSPQDFNMVAQNPAALKSKVLICYKLLQRSKPS